MKRIIITALMMLSAGAINSIQAQKSRQYDDDIYGGKPSEQKQEAPARTNTDGNVQDDERTYSSSGNNASSGGSMDSRDNSRQYNSDEYYDSDDDYYYSSRISRFNYPFYNRPYWSSFYNPYWYDPYWVDPYWGYSPWTRPGLSISFGYGPYWSSYWGWSSWYGNPYFGSYYAYPSYGYGGYYSGYWNGYYAGMYNGGYGDAYGARRQNITYGPRYSLRPNSTRAVGTSGAGYNGFRTSPTRNTMSSPEAGTVRSEGFRRVPETVIDPSRDERGRDAAIRNNPDNVSPRTDDRPVRNGWNESNINRGNEANPQQAPRRDRGSWYSGGRTESPATPRSSETPRVQENRGYQQSQPRSEQRYESTPSRGADRGSFGGGGGGRSFGGGNNGGGGGGSFGGGGGRRR
jgi:hypothetical protein